MNKKIKSIKIDNLFGSKSYDINFKDKISVIEGINGVGKTTILKLIKAVLMNDIIVVNDIDFDYLKIVFESNKKELESANEDWIEIKKPMRERRIKSSDFPKPSDDYEYRRWLYGEKYPRGTLYVMASNKGKYNIKVTYRDLFQQIRLNNSHRAKEQMLYRHELGYYETILEEPICNCKIIGTDRLWNDNSNLNSSKQDENQIKNKKINDCNKQIKEWVVNSLSELNEEINIEIKNFAKKLRNNEININKRKKALKTYNENINKYSRLGVLKNNPTEEYFDNENLANNESADLFDYFYIETFNKSIKDCFESKPKEIDKRLNDKIKGLYILQDLIKLLQSDYTDKIFMCDSNGASYRICRSDQRISLDSLSSGEQHIFVMLYELLFNGNGIILIDEPEISLHVVWQEKYVEIIKKVLENNKNISQVIIATHSPLIMNGCDSTIEL